MGNASRKPHVVVHVIALSASLNTQRARTRGIEGEHASGKVSLPEGDEQPGSDLFTRDDKVLVLLGLAQKRDQILSGLIDVIKVGAVLNYALELIKLGRIELDATEGMVPAIPDDVSLL